MHYSKLTCIATIKKEEINLKAETAFPAQAALADLHLSRSPSLSTVAALTISLLVVFLRRDIMTNLSIVK